MLAPPLKGGSSVGRCDVLMAACSVIVTAAVIVAVKASTYTLLLVLVPVSGGRVVTVEVEDIDRASLDRPSIPDGLLR